MTELCPGEPETGTEALGNVGASTWWWPAALPTSRRAVTGACRPHCRLPTPGQANTWPAVNTPRLLTRSHTPLLEPSLYPRLEVHVPPLNPGCPSSVSLQLGLSGHSLVTVCLGLELVTHLLTASPGLRSPLRARSTSGSSQCFAQARCDHIWGTDHLQGGEVPS